MLQIERPERQVHVVTRHVAERARAEIPPTPPVRGLIGRVIRPHRRGSDPEVPVQALRHRGHVGGPLAARPRLAAPDVALADRPDRPGLDDFDDASIVVLGMDLRPHLGRDLRLRREVGHRAGLIDRVGQRLLAIDMLAHAKRHRGGRRMHMIGRADDHGVEPAGLQHLAEVGVLLRAREPLPGLVEQVVIDVADGDDVLALNALDVALQPGPPCRRRRCSVSRSPRGPRGRWRGRRRRLRRRLGGGSRGGTEA